MTATPASDIPLSIDYTGRDYYAIREQLIARVQDRIPSWTGANPSDFGVALVEAFAYLGDLMSYYIDRNANESFITTATQRDSIINIAQSYGYVPAGYRQATVTLTFSNSTDDTPVTLPKGTVVSGDVVVGDTVNTVYFTTDEEVVSNPSVDNGTVTVLALHGQDVSLVSPNATSKGELVGVSSGLPNQSFELGENPVVDGTVYVYVKDGDQYSKWKQVQHIIDYGPYDQVFAVSTDANNNVYVNFGDGVSGQIPTNMSDVRVQYTVGGGSIGNVVIDTLTNIDYVPGLSGNDLTALQSIITVSNLELALGGSDPEPWSQIRYSAPLSLRANNRAVTLEDFRSIALGVSGIGHAKATADVWTSVTLYVSPTRTASDTDLAPGLDDLGATTVEYDRNKADVESALANKTLLGTTVTVQPPTYVDVILAIQYTPLPQYTTAEVEANIKAAIVTEYGYVNMDFAETIHQQDVEFTLNNSVAGVKIAKLTVMHRSGDTGLNTIIANASEILRFQEGNISVGTI